MHFRRLISPEVSPVRETVGSEQLARKLGGFTLGLFGYAAGLGAIVNSPVTGGLSLPILGGLSAAFMAGSRALMRPAYQDADHDSPTKSETFGEKSLRIGSFVGGIALVNLGINLFTGGVFNTFGEISLTAPGRIINTVAGLVGIGLGERFVRGSYDPNLHEPFSEHKSRSGFVQAFKDGYNTSRGKVNTPPIATRVI